MDDEILADFLVEAEEILARLDAQLLEMERDPHDQALLDAVFRGFFIPSRAAQVSWPWNPW